MSELAKETKRAQPTNYMLQPEQHPDFLMADISSLLMLIVCPFGRAAGSSAALRVFLLATRYICVSTSVKACSTFKASRADVSMKYNPSFSANSLASFVGTASRCRRSALFPTNMITMLQSVWPRSSFSHLLTLSYVDWRVTSYTSRAPTAPR